jgi:hypothetical protein
VCLILAACGRAEAPPRDTTTFRLPLDTIESLGALASRHEAQPWFDAAHDALVRQDRESAAIALSDAATFLQKEWDKAPGDARVDLVRAVEELDSLAGVVAHGDLRDPRALDHVFARAHAAEASFHLLRANRAMMRREHVRAGEELVMSIDHLERAAQDAGIKRDAVVQTAIADTRSLAGEMMRGMEAVPDEGAKITDEVERAIRRIRAATTRG